MPNDLILSTPGIGDDHPAALLRENPRLDGEDRPVKRVDRVEIFLKPRVNPLPALEPLPVAAVTRPENVLIEGSLETVYDVECFPSQEPPGIQREAQDPEKGSPPQRRHPVKCEAGVGGFPGSP